MGRPTVYAGLAGLLLIWGCGTSTPTGNNDNPPTDGPLPVQGVQGEPLSGLSADDVNPSGLVVGAFAGGCNRLPGFWSPEGVATMLPLPEGACGGTARRVSANGFIAGTASPEGGGSRPVRWTPGVSGYTAELLSLPDTLNVDVFDVNDAGNVVGVMYRSLAQPRQAVWWSSAEGWKTLEMPEGKSRCSARGLNSADAIVGSCSVHGVGGTDDAFYWPAPEAAPVMLPRVPGREGPHAALAISETGWVLGLARVELRTDRAARWRHGETGWEVYPIPEYGSHQIEPVDINDDGHVVGRVPDGPFTGFYWTPEEELRQLSPSSGRPHAITRSATDGKAIIVGIYGDTPEGFRAMRWRP